MTKHCDNVYVFWNYEAGIQLVLRLLVPYFVETFSQKVGLDMSSLVSTLIADLFMHNLISTKVTADNQFPPHI